MRNWASICQIMRHADKQDEMAYQKYIKDMVLEIGLGWHVEQIIEQPSLRLGSMDRIVPDILVSKDCRNRFVVEVKKPGHVKTSKDIDQLVSYMKQLETSVGIYWGDEMEVYYKNIGDGSQPILLMSLHFKSFDSNGEDFVSLFSENCFSIENILSFMREKEAKRAFESNVERLLKDITASNFQDEFLDVLKTYLMKKGESENIVDAVLSQVVFRLSAKSEDVDNIAMKDVTEYSHATEKKVKKRRRDNSKARHYAYNLIKQIIEKNSTFSFEQLYAIFNSKDYIENVVQVKDESRWFMDEEDIITIADGTKIVISNQWGFKNRCKPKMDNVRAVAKKYGIEVLLP